MPDYSRTRSEYLRIMLGDSDERYRSLSPEQINDVGTTSYDAASFDAQETERFLSDYETYNAAKQQESQSGSDANGWEKFLNTGRQIGLNIFEGFLNFFDSIWDFGVDLASSFGWVSEEDRQAATGYDWQAQATNFLDLLDLPGHLVSGEAFGEDYWNRWRDLGSDEASRESLNENVYNATLLSGTPVGDFVTNVEQSIGFMIPSIAMAAATGGSSAGAQAASLSTMAAGAFGAKGHEVYDKTGDMGKAVASAAVSAGIEVGTELLGDVLGISKIMGVVGKGSSRVTENVLGRIALEMAGEGAEEFVSAVLEPVVGAISEGSEAFKRYKDPTFWVGTNADSVLMQTLSGSVTGGIMGGPSIVYNRAQYGKYGQAVVESRQELDKARMEKDKAIRKFGKDSKQAEKASKKAAEALAEYVGNLKEWGDSATPKNAQNMAKSIARLNGDYSIMSQIGSINEGETSTVRIGDLSFDVMNDGKSYYPIANSASELRSILTAIDPETMGIDSMYVSAKDPETGEPFRFKIDLQFFSEESARRFADLKSSDVTVADDGTITADLGDSTLTIDKRAKTAAVRSKMPKEFKAPKASKEGYMTVLDEASRMYREMKVEEVLRDGLAVVRVKGGYAVAETYTGRLISMARQATISAAREYVSERRFINGIKESRERLANNEQFRKLVEEAKAKKLAQEARKTTQKGNDDVSVKKASQRLKSSIEQTEANAVANLDLQKIKIDKSTNKIIRTEESEPLFKIAEKALDIAKKHEAAAEKMFKNISADFGLEIKYAGLKSLSSYADRLYRNIQNGETNPLLVKDDIRGSLIFKSQEQVSNLNKVIGDFKDFGCNFLDENKPIDVKDGPFYKGCHLNLKIDDTTFEVQLHTDKSWELKMKGDAFYDKWRSRLPENHTRDDVAKLPESERLEYVNDQKKQHEIGKAYLDEPLFVNLRSSSSEISSDSYIKSRKLTEPRSLTHSPSTSSSYERESKIRPSGNLETIRSTNKSSASEYIISEQQTENTNFVGEKIISDKQRTSSVKLIEEAADSTKPAKVRLKAVDAALQAALSESLPQGWSGEISYSSKTDTYAEMNLAEPKNMAKALDNAAKRVLGADVRFEISDYDGGATKLRDLVTPEQESRLKDIIKEVLEGNAEPTKLAAWAKALKLSKIRNAENIRTFKSIASIERTIDSAMRDYVAGPDAPISDLQIYTTLLDGVNAPFGNKSMLALADNVLANYTEESIGSKLAEFGMTTNLYVRELASRLKESVVPGRQPSPLAIRMANDVLALLNNDLKELRKSARQTNIQRATPDVVRAQASPNFGSKNAAGSFVQGFDMAIRSPINIVETFLGRDSALATHLRDGGKSASNAYSQRYSEAISSIEGYAEKAGFKSMASLTKAMSEKMSFMGSRITKAQALSIVSTAETYGLQSLIDYGIAIPDARGNDGSIIKFSQEDYQKLKEGIGAELLGFRADMASEFFGKSMRDYTDSKMMELCGVHFPAIEGEYFPGSRVGMKEPDLAGVTRTGSIDPISWGLSQLQERKANKLPFRIRPYDSVVNSYVNSTLQWGEWAQWYKELKALENTRVYGTTLTNEMRKRVGSQSWDRMMDFVHKTALGIPFDNKIGIVGNVFDKVFGNLQQVAMTDIFTQTKTLGSLATLYQYFGMSTALKGEAQYVRNKAMFGDRRSTQVIESLSPTLKERFHMQEQFSSSLWNVAKRKATGTLQTVVRKLDQGIHVGQAWAMSQVKAMQEGYGDPWTDSNNERAVRILEEASDRTQPTTSKFNVGQFRAGANGPIIKRFFGMFASMSQNVYQGFYDFTFGWATEGKRIKSYRSRIADINARISELETERKAISGRLESAQSLEEYRSAADELAKNERSLKDNRAASDLISKELSEAESRHTAKAWANQSSGWLAGAIGSAIIMSLIARLKKKAFKDEDWDSEAFVSDALYMSFVNWIPFVNTIANAIRNDSDLSIFTASNVNEIIDSVKGMADAIGSGDAGKIIGQIGKIAKVIGEAGLGMPVGAVSNILNAAWYRIDNESNLKTREWLGFLSATKLRQNYADAVQSGNRRKAVSNLSVWMSEESAGTTDRISSELYALSLNGQSALPSSIPSSYQDDNGEKLSVTAAERERFRQIYSKSKATVQSLIDSAVYKAMTAEERARILKKAYGAYYEYAKYKVLGIDPTSKLGMLLAYADGNVELAMHILLMQRISSLTPTATTTKKTLAVRLANQSGLSRGGRLLALTLAGYKVGEDGGKALQAYLRSLGMTSSQAASFA